MSQHDIMPQPNLKEKHLRYLRPSSPSDPLRFWDSYHQKSKEAIKHSSFGPYAWQDWANFWKNPTTNSSSPMTSRLLVRFLAPTFPPKPMEPDLFWGAALLALKNGALNTCIFLTNTICNYILTIHVRYRYLHIHIESMQEGFKVTEAY